MGTPRVHGFDMGNLGSVPNPHNIRPPTFDTAEQIVISSLALLKMLKHARAGVPMEVMGLMLGEFVDDYTVSVVDVFAMPQSGTGVSVESVDPVFQARMLEFLRATGRPELVVGWYHSHPGFGCWLSGVDINTQKNFEALGERVVAVVIDPIQSVKGKVIIDAFRLIDSMTVILEQEPRQTTSMLGHLTKPNMRAMQQGLNRHYYSIAINFRKREAEQQMLLKVHSKHWSHALKIGPFAKHVQSNVESLQTMAQLAKNYNKSLVDEEKMTKRELALKNVGKQDPKRHLEEVVEQSLAENVMQGVRTMLSSVVFK